MNTTGIAIEDLVIPASTDDPAWGPFREMIALRNAVETDRTGTDVFGRTPEEALPGYQDQEWNPARVVVVRDGDRMVGRGVYAWAIEPGAKIAWLTVEVLPDARGRGIGTAIADHVEGLAIADGRTTFQTWVPHDSRPGGERVPSPTGFGDLPADDIAVRFLSRRGYRLEQVERISTLPLPVPEETLARYRETARAAAGDTYRVVTWVGPTPEDRLDDMCWLRNRMSVDIPAGAMEVVEEEWTAERIRAEERRAEAAGRTLLTAAAEHVPTGRLAGYTVLWLPEDPARPVEQDATLVTSDHRGHKLGMLLKVANIDALREYRPDAPLIATGNAEENRYMLATNEAVGFRALYAEGAWEKRVGD